MNYLWLPWEYFGMTSASRGFTANRLMEESHDEERLMYKICSMEIAQTQRIM
jgi:hypothetical protein